MQQQLQQQQLMMQQLMMQMMQNQQGGGQQPQQQAAPAANSSPQTRAEVLALLDSLDMKLATGEISEAIYNRLVEKWQQRLSELGG